MSSKGSEEDDLIVHPLPWRADHVNSIFSEIDHHLQLSQSGKSKSTKKKKDWNAFSTYKPISAPSWAVQN